MKHLLLCAVATALVSTSAQAQPYCDALLDASALAKKYQRLAPIYSSQETGWIFGSDQLDEVYAMKAEANALFTNIVSEFDAAGVKLAVLIAPPRPIVAGQDVVTATLGNDSYNVAKARASFEFMIAQVHAAGAVVPNLLDVASAEAAEPYYFKRDTHWTNTGAAVSMNALAREFGADAVGIDIDNLNKLEIASERGSLSDIVDASCGARDAGEPTPIYDYASLNSGAGLLDETTGPNVALLGTSFSDRYKRDAYQAADALATAFGANVENFSVSGGGMIGPIEAYVLSGALQAKSHDLVVWEFPYTESLNATSTLRQLLGALRLAKGATGAATSITLSAKARAEIKIAEANQPELVVLQNVPAETKKVYVDVQLDDGSKKTIKLRRKPSVLAGSDIESWAVDLTGWNGRTITSIQLRFEKQDAGQSVRILFGA